jgi:hypothetical protein
LLTPAHNDIHSIPWDSVVLPFGTPVNDSHGGVLKGVPTRPCILVIGLHGHSLGAVPQPRLLPPLRSSLQAFLGEAQMCVCSPSSTWDSSDREGQLFLLALELGCFSREATIARCYDARQRKGNNYLLHFGDTMAPSKSCRSKDTNVLLAIVTKWEDMSCTPGTTLGYLLLPRTHETQKPSASQGLYPILLLALLALMTSAYTSLGVSQDSNPQRQLLKASVYHSATSAVREACAITVQGMQYCQKQKNELTC